MPDADRLTPASSDDLADALAFALRYSGRTRTHDAGEMMAAIVAKRLVEHLERSGSTLGDDHPRNARRRVERRRRHSACRGNGMAGGCGPYVILNEVGGEVHSGSK